MNTFLMVVAGTFINGTIPNLGNLFTDHPFL